MRCDQFMGLSPAAEAFLHENEVFEETQPPCPCCKRPYPNKPMEVVGEYMGMFSETYCLFRHKLKDGCTADEFVQAEPWSSGPCFFIGLRVSNGTEFLWSEEEINEA